MKRCLCICVLLIDSLIDWLAPGVEAAVYLLSIGRVLGVPQSFSVWRFCSEEPDFTQTVWAEDGHPSPDQGENTYNNHLVHMDLYVWVPMWVTTWSCRPMRTEQRSSLIAPPSSWLLMETTTKVWAPTSLWDEPTNYLPVSKKTCTRWGKRGVMSWWWWSDDVMMMSWYLFYRWRPTWRWQNVDSLQRPTAPCSHASLLWNHCPRWWCNCVCSVAPPPRSLTLISG